MDVDQMPAGPELDALVAERVMGTGRPHEWVNDGYPGSLETWEACLHCDLERKKSVPGGLCHPRYSTDIAAAFEVVDKIHDDQPRFILEAQPFVRPRVWWCSVYGYDRIQAPTAPLAICRAALKLAALKPAAVDVAIPGKGDA